MNKVWLAAGATIVAGSLACPAAVAQSRNIPQWSAAARTTACRADCLPQNTHGLYKFYHREDPTLMSVAGKKMYADCVRICLAPLPAVYVQRPLLEGGGIWFGSNAADCQTCHVQEPNLRVPPGQRPTQAAPTRRGH